MGGGEYWFEVVFNIRAHLSPTLAYFLYAPLQHSSEKKNFPQVEKILEGH